MGVGCADGVGESCLNNLMVKSDLKSSLYQVYKNNHNLGNRKPRIEFLFSANTFMLENSLELKVLGGLFVNSTC